MPCYHPITGYYGNEISARGKRPLVFKPEKAFSGVPIRLPCGRCIGCRLERSRQWAMRCMHEKLFYDNNVFLTLTYDDKHLPDDGGLRKRDLQLFMKRLRKEEDREPGDGVRFFACGEYGSISRRPHYHVILFNCGFSDAKFYKLAGKDERMYTSARVARLWPYGFNVLGSVTFDSCAYVARYVCDKVTGDKSEDHYVSAEGVVLAPEFCVMSRRPGIGSRYFEKYGMHVYQLDSVSVNNRDVRPPKFYDLKYEVLDPVHMEELKVVRRARAFGNRGDNTPERRRVREHVVVRALNDKAKRGV